LSIAPNKKHEQPFHDYAEQPPTVSGLYAFVREHHTCFGIPRSSARNGSHIDNLSISQYNHNRRFIIVIDVDAEERQMSVKLLKRDEKYAKSHELILETAARVFPKNDRRGEPDLRCRRRPGKGTGTAQGYADAAIYGKGRRNTDNPLSGLRLFVVNINGRWKG